MPVPTGTASMLDIQNVFGGSAPISLSEYYGAAAGVPTSGTISINHFRGKSAGVTISKAFELYQGLYKGVLETFLYQSVTGPWDGNPQSLTFPRAAPFLLDNSSGTDPSYATWPIYCWTYQADANTYPLGNPSHPLNALIFQSNAGGYARIGVTFNKTFIQGGIYQNGSLIYPITSVDSVNFITGSAPGNVVRFFFGVNIMSELAARASTGNKFGYEMRITYVP